MQTTKKLTIIHRILHWTIAIAMPIMFTTGFLQTYWMNKNGMIGVIENKTAASTLPQDVMTDIASTIREPMWEWHEILANVMIAAFVA